MRHACHEGWPDTCGRTGLSKPDGTLRPARDQSLPLASRLTIEYTCTAMRHILLTFFTATLPLMPVVLHAQVTTATLYGVVRDATAASVPGALITVAQPGDRPVPGDRDGCHRRVRGDGTSRPAGTP